MSHLLSPLELNSRDHAQTRRAEMILNTTRDRAQRKFYLKWYCRLHTARQTLSETVGNQGTLRQNCLRSPRSTPCFPSCKTCMAVSSPNGTDRILLSDRGRLCYVRERLVRAGTTIDVGGRGKAAPARRARRSAASWKISPSVPSRTCGN